MAYLPPEMLPFGSAKTKTVFMPHGATMAEIVIRQGDSFTRRPKKFVSAQAALAWCLEQGAAFYYFPPADPARN